MYYKKVVEVYASALKHGVRTDDVLHVYEHAIGVFDLEQGDPDKVLFIGPDRSSRMLEVIGLDVDGRHVLIHAMKLRTKFAMLLEEADG